MLPSNRCGFVYWLPTGLSSIFRLASISSTSLGFFQIFHCNCCYRRCSAHFAHKSARVTGTSAWKSQNSRGLKKAFQHAKILSCGSTSSLGYWSFSLLKSAVAIFDSSFSFLPLRFIDLTVEKFSANFVHSFRNRRHRFSTETIFLKQACFRIPAFVCIVTLLVVRSSVFIRAHHGICADLVIGAHYWRIFILNEDYHLALSVDRYFGVTRVARTLN